MDADVVVVGGGVMGLATAWRLAVTGTDVVLVERFEIGHNRGSSHGATRIFRYLYEDPMYVRMAQATLPMWSELERVSGTSLLRMTGGLHLDTLDALERHRAAMASCGVAYEFLTPVDRSERFPWISKGNEPALWLDDIGVISAERTLRALRYVASRTGARIVEGNCVESIAASDGVLFSTSSGPLAARTCVVAAGAWIGDLLRSVDISLPLRVTREQSVHFTGGADVLPFVHGRDHWIYGVPSFDGDGVVKVAEHGTGPETTADGRDFALDEDAFLRIYNYVVNALPWLDREPIGHDTCLYTSTPDGDFVLDRRGPVVVLSTCSGHGFKFAPLVGEIAACLATGREPPLDIERFSMDRF